MSSSSAAFFHALSPSLDALTQAVLTSTHSTNPDGENLVVQSNERILVLHAKLADCRTVDQIVDAVPADYRPAFREHLLKFASWCEKLETVKASLDRLSAALTAQTVPPRLHVKAPKFQFTKEFGDSTSQAASATRNAFSLATAVFQAAINEASLAGKKAEVQFWEDKCNPDSQLEKLAAVVNQVWQDRCSSFRVPTIVYNEQGQPTLGNWVYSSQKIIEKDMLIRAIPLFGSQLKVVTALRHHAMAVKISKKKDIAAKADVEMANATKPGPSINNYRGRPSLNK